MRESLFKIPDILKPKPDNSLSFSAMSKNDNFFSSANSKAELIKAIGKIEQDKSVFTFANGKWSSHELLAYILEQTGPANVWITSWSITEEPLRLLNKLKVCGYINELHCLFGDRVPVMSPVAWQYANYNIPGIKLSKCHAKVQVIRNESWDIVIMGSANFTMNPRWEAGVVCCCKEVAIEYAKAIEQAMINGYTYGTERRKIK